MVQALASRADLVKPYSGCLRRNIPPNEQRMYSYETEIIEKEESSILMNVGPSHPATHGTLRLKMRDTATDQVELEKAHQLVDRHMVRLKVADLHRRHRRG
jgi:hypothetical protein